MSSSLETHIKQLSDRLLVVEKQLSAMAADVKELRALNGMDVSSSSKLVPLLTKDDVSQHAYRQNHLAIIPIGF